MILRDNVRHKDNTCTQYRLTVEKYLSRIIFSNNEIDRRQHQGATLVDRAMAQFRAREVVASRPLE